MRDFASTARATKMLLVAPILAMLAGGVVRAERPYIHVGRQADVDAQPYVIVEMTRDDGLGNITEIGPYGSSWGGHFRGEKGVIMRAT